jgi:hypothetical protein
MAKIRHSEKVKLRKMPALRVLSLGMVAVLTGSLAISCGSRQGQQSKGASDAQELRERIVALTRQEQILSAELSVAKSPEPYISIDFPNRKIELKVQGRSLRSFSISKISRTGGPSFVAQSWAEIEAKPLQIPARAKMVPGSGEETTSSIATLNPWGPKRMPADFDLICKEDRVVGFRSIPSAQSRLRFTRWIIGGYRQARNWVRDLLGRRKSAYRESLEIWLAEDDAQLLFWSLPKQFNILLLNAS